MKVQTQPISQILPVQQVTRSPQSPMMRVVYLIDRSGSMDQSAGGIGLKQVAAHITQINQHAQANDECMLIAFGGGVELLQATKKIKDIKQIPLPTRGSGSSLLAPAIALASRWAQDAQRTQWVIISDGKIADENQVWSQWSQWLQKKQIEVYWSRPYLDRWEQNRQHITPLRSPTLQSNSVNPMNQASPSMRSFMQTTQGQVVDWSQLHKHIWQDTRVIPRDLKGRLSVQASDFWADHIGGPIQSIQGLTMSQAKKQAQVLTYVDQYPALLKSNYGAGQVWASMTKGWSFSHAQWKNILALLYPQSTKQWDIYWRNSLVWAQGNPEEILSGRVQQNLQGKPWSSLQWCPLLGGISLLSQLGDCHLAMGKLPTKSLQTPILDLYFTHQQKPQHKQLEQLEQQKTNEILHYETTKSSRRQSISAIQQYVQKTGGQVVAWPSSMTKSRSMPFSADQASWVSPQHVVQKIKDQAQDKHLISLWDILIVLILLFLWDLYQDYKAYKKS